MVDRAEHERIKRRKWFKTLPEAKRRLLSDLKARHAIFRVEYAWHGPSAGNYYQGATVIAVCELGLVNIVHERGKNDALKLSRMGELMMEAVTPTPIMEAAE